MDAERLARLTEKQRVCLRLVYSHLSSKEIARELGIGADAVDQRLKTAMRTLGVETRIDAARLLAEQEGALTYQQGVYQTSDVVSQASLVTSRPGTQQGAEFGQGPVGTMVREEQAPFEALRWQPPRILPLPLLWEGGVRNDLGPWQRLAWILAIAIATAIGFGAFLSGLQALSELV